MIPSQAVTDAFRRSALHVDRLSLVKGPLEKPQAEIIENVCATLWERKGKRLRSHLVYWFGEMASVAPETLHLYAWAAEAIHTATLLHDDIIDEADIRRGKPSANKIFDNTLPVLSGDYLLSDAVYQLAIKGDTKSLAGLCQTLKALVSGECLQYEMRYTIPVSEEAYRNITRLKTTSLLLWAASVGPSLSGTLSLEVVERFIDGFGTVFQFSDDVLDVVGSATKGKWTDLKEGKLNFVTWQLIQQNPKLAALTQAHFSKRQVPDELIEAFEDYATSRGALEPAYRRLREIVRQSELALKELPECETRRALQGLIGLCADRCS